jgi:hypothetical protein
MAIEYITTTSGRILVPEQQTPAEAAKIDLNLNPQNRLKDLIVKSAAQKEIAEGKRVQHVNIVNEKDCIKVMLKGWLDKQVWKGNQRHTQSTSICLVVEWKG